MLHIKTLCYSALSGLLLLVATASSKAQTTDPYAGIIPAPAKLTKIAGNFTLSQETRIITDSADNKAVVFLASYLKDHRNLNLAINRNPGITGNQSLYIRYDASLPAEGYHLTVTPAQISIVGKGAGLFYGVQTLIQLFDNQKQGSINVPCVDIEDAPRFGYRGIHLDVSRHFFSVEEVKKIIDLAAQYKLNTFHWHLTDDQGWRIEIKKYPRLTQVGSLRAQTVIGNFNDRTPWQYDNTPHGGYYTQDQVRDVVKYAAERYITIIPEIEMPGHSSAVLAAYPEFGCEPGKQYQVAQIWGVFKDIFCPTDKTFAFLEDVLTEVMGLFPSKYIHIGGDEVPKDAWEKSAFCQNLIRKLKLKNEHGLQSYFIQRIEKFVNSKGRNIIGWDEILEGGLAPNATVMSWRGEAGGIAAAKQNHNVIMTPSSGGLYLDHAQGKSDLEPLSIGGYAPLAKTYAYNPIPAALTEAQQRYILGVQANVWTEYIATDAKLEYQLLPRMLALAEVAWSPLANKNFQDFSEVRLPHHLALLDREDYNFRVPAAIGAPDSIITASGLNVNLKAPVEGAKIYYTIDDLPPRTETTLYEHPFTLTVPENNYRQLQTIVVTPSGKRSVVTKATVYNRGPLAPSTYQPTRVGLKYQLTPGAFNSTDQISAGLVTDTGEVKGFYTNDFKKANRERGGFGIIYNGYIRIDTDGKYTFSTRSDNGSVLLIDDQPVVDNYGRHSMFEKGGDVLLKRGYHKFTLKYFDVGVGGNLQVYWTMPGKIKMDITSDYLSN
ncbi:family 20 glycosylhydrolase [Mucilaginibacter sp. RS28]|uniref:beta-N-acetylhexosaminidase n=1 Tax=Mucilaginibacter straminoryzae TaxID=2932774 RepID=A0A9X2BAW3_9SPHI|nr:family 20 glycosylhydrolase [Mucilaginibacter straminoryzae]MCJ8211185.1 family 20 glycosylhydrolase [Mucilaginibacter straminoryzae]